MCDLLCSRASLQYGPFAHARCHINNQAKLFSIVYFTKAELCDSCFFVCRSFVRQSVCLSVCL